MLAQGLMVLSFLLSAWAFANWRIGFYGAIVLTVLQDPVRKLTPGAPGYLALIAAPVVVACIAGLITSRPRWWSDFERRVPAVAEAYLLFAAACVPAALISATYASGSWAYTVLGIASYGTLFMSIVLGFNLLQSERALRRLMIFYCLVTSCALIGGWLQWSGSFDHWRSLGSDALGMHWIRYRPGYIVELIGGFYRSPDVMGWHAAACGMLAMTLALNSPGAKRYLWLAVAAFAVATLLLCGRRKMVFMLPLFIFVIIGLSWMSGRSRSVGTVVAGGLLVVAVVAVGMVVAGGGDAEALRYYLEGSADTLDSLEAHGFGTVVGTLRQTGFFGGGLGFATPGAHQIPFASPRVWQESAPSRVMFELGVPGMAALVFLLARMSRDAWRIVLGAARVGGAGGRYAVGMFAFFICNVGSLTVSGQILGDPFIAAFIGISLGITLGFARFLPERYGRAAARAHGRLRPVSATEKTSAR